MTRRPDRAGLSERLAGALRASGVSDEKLQAFFRAFLAALDTRVTSVESVNTSQAASISSLTSTNASQDALISAIIAGYASDTLLKWDPTYNAVLRLLHRFCANGGVATGVVGSAVTLTGWTTVLSAGGYVVAEPGDEITVPGAGDYSYNLDVTVLNSAGTASAYVTLFQADGGTGTWAGFARAWANSITTAVHGSMTITGKRTFVANEKVRVQLQRSAGSGTGGTVTTGCRLSLQRIT